MLLSQGLPSVSGSALRSREIHDLLILGKQATASHNEKETQKAGNLKEQYRSQKFNLFKIWATIGALKSPQSVSPRSNYSNAMSDKSELTLQAGPG